MLNLNMRKGSKRNFIPFSIYETNRRVCLYLLAKDCFINSAIFILSFYGLVNCQRYLEVTRCVKAIGFKMIEYDILNFAISLANF